MNTIDIIIEGRTVSRIVQGSVPEGVAAFLEDYPEIFMVYDSRTESHAERIQRALMPSGRLKSVCSIETSEDGKTMVLLPGTACTWQANFARVIDALAERYHLICVNYDGFEGDPSVVFTRNFVSSG